MVHGWYQNPFPTHTLKCPQSDKRDHTACSSATKREGRLPGGDSWVSTNSPTASSANQPQPNHRFPFWPFGTLRTRHLGRRVLRAHRRTQHNRLGSRTGAMDAEGRAAFDRDAKGSDGNDETHNEEDSAGRTRSRTVRGACMHDGRMRRWWRRAGRIWRRCCRQQIGLRIPEDRSRRLHCRIARRWHVLSRRILWARWLLAARAHHEHERQAA